MRRKMATSSAAAIVILIAAGSAHAINPATWQINEQVNRTDTIKTWTSPTAVDLGKMLWKYDFAISKVTGTVSVPLIGEITQDITNSLPAEIRMGSGQTSDLPVILLDNAIADPSSGTTADLLVEIDAGGFGRAVFSNIMLGSVSVPIFGTRPIQRVNVEATVNVTGYNFGDYDLNGVVNAADHTTWKNAFQGIAINGFADGNLDGVVNAADYTVWRDAISGGGGSGAFAVVPEPAAWLLLLGAFSALAIRVRV
jgi:hypothetical protein